MQFFLAKILSRRYRLYFFLSACLPGLLAGTLFAQQPNRPADAQNTIPSSYIYDIWTTEDGLPQNWVYDVTQTEDGYLWVGTGTGLARFDGITFTVFDQGNTPELPNNEILHLFTDAEGILWIETREGLLSYRDGRFRRYTTEDGLINNITSIRYGDRNGDVWFSSSGGWVRYRAGTFTSFPELLDPGTAPGIPVEELEEGILLWIDRTLHLFQDSTVVPVLAEGSPIQDPIPVLRDRRGNLWLWRDSGPIRYPEKLPGNVTTPTDLQPSNIQLLYEDREGQVWIGLNRGGLYRWTGQVYVKELSVSSRIDRITEDREGNIWVCTRGEGLVRLKTPTKFNTITARDGLPDDVIWAIIEGRDGARWMGTDLGLSRFQNGRYKTFTEADGLPGNRVFSLHDDRDGILWIGTSVGLASYDGRGFKTYPAANYPDAFAIVRGEIVKDRTGTVWVGTSRGLGRVSNGILTRVELFPPGEQSTFVQVRGLLEDRQGVLWIGTEEDGLIRYQNGQFGFLNTDDGLPDNFVQSFYEEQDDTIWITTHGGGLARYRDGQIRVVSTQHGLFDDTIHRILEDNQSRFWMSTNRGVFSIHKDALHAVADGRAGLVTSVVYGSADGLRSVECNSGSPGAFQSLDGRLWFSTMIGAAVIDPADIRVNTVPPPVVIEALLVDYRPVSLETVVVLEPATRGIAIRYTALSFVAPQKVQFKYRLDGYDTDWVDAGTRRTAFYTNIPPGSYTFLVQAANNDGVWNESGATLSFVLQPHFYQSSWFYISVVMGFFLTAYVAYRFRLRQIRERELVTLVEERTAELRQALKHLTETQDRLIHAEKMASLGKLTAGIAHEMKNPLNFINNFAELSIEQINELLEELETNKDEKILDKRKDLGDVLSDLKFSAERIHKHGRRADGIVRSMMEHSRGAPGERRYVDVNELVDEYVNVSYHGMRAQVPDLDVKIARLYDETAGKVEMEPQEMGRVVVNVLNNAFEAAHRRALSAEDSFEPAVKVSTQKVGDRVEIRVCDNGPGIPEDIQSKIFEPFFTTKPPGAGTGLGLSLSYEIVTEGYGGTLTVESTGEDGTTFVITLPVE